MPTDYHVLYCMPTYYHVYCMSTCYHNYYTPTFYHLYCMPTYCNTSSMLTYYPVYYIPTDYQVMAYVGLLHVYLLSSEVYSCCHVFNKYIFKLEQYFAPLAVVGAFQQLS